MPDERMESLKQGIAADPASREAHEAEQRRERELTRSPVESDSAMGGTSDEGSAADESFHSASRNVELSDEDLERLRRREDEER